MAIAGLIVSVAGIGLSAISLSLSHRSTVAAVAGIRPIIKVSVTRGIRVADSLQIGFSVQNLGKSSAAIVSLRMIGVTLPGTGFSPTPREFGCEIPSANGIVLRAGEARDLTPLAIDRFHTVGDTVIDLAKGVDDQRRLRVRVTYEGLELGQEVFEQVVNIGTVWEDGGKPAGKRTNPGDDY